MSVSKRPALAVSIIFNALVLSACGGSSSSDPIPVDSGTPDIQVTDTGMSEPTTSDTEMSGSEMNGTGMTAAEMTGTDTDTEMAGTGTTGTEMTNTDMTDPVMAEPEMIDIDTAIRGAWSSTCLVLADGARSVQQVFVFNDTELIRDWFEYDGIQCEGVPRGRRFPLLVDEYTLGADITTPEGIPAMEIDLTIKQLPTSDFVPTIGTVAPTGIEVGDERFTIVSFMDGKVLWQDREPTNRDNRFTDLNNAVELTPRTSLTSADLAVEDLYGIYRGPCRDLGEGNYAYQQPVVGTDNVDRRQEYFFTNHLCLGEPEAIVEEPHTIEFGDVFTDQFGDTMISAVRTQQQQFIVKGSEFIDFELRGPRDPRFSAYALVADSLMLGDCIIRVNECATTSEFADDHVDYELNSSIRFMKTDSIEPAPGTSDTSTIAGTWNGSSDTDAGGQSLFYIVISNNGLATYYNSEIDPASNSEDCFTVSTEVITNFGNDQYLYNGMFDSGETYSYADTATVADGSITFIDSNNTAFVYPEFTGDVSSFEECV